MTNSYGDRLIYGSGRNHNKSADWNRSATRPDLRGNALACVVARAPRDPARPALRAPCGPPSPPLRVGLGLRLRGPLPAPPARIGARASGPPCSPFRSGRAVRSAPAARALVGPSSSRGAARRSLAPCPVGPGPRALLPRQAVAARSRSARGFALFALLASRLRRSGSAPPVVWRRPGLRSRPPPPSLRARCAVAPVVRCSSRPARLLATARAPCRPPRSLRVFAAAMGPLRGPNRLASLAGSIKVPPGCRSCVFWPYICRISSKVDNRMNNVWKTVLTAVAAIASALLAAFFTSCASTTRVVTRTSTTYGASTSTVSVTTDARQDVELKVDSTLNISVPIERKER